MGSISDIRFSNIKHINEGLAKLAGLISPGLELVLQWSNRLASMDADLLLQGSQNTASLPVAGFQDCATSTWIRLL